MALPFPCVRPRRHRSACLCVLPCFALVLGHVLGGSIFPTTSLAGTNDKKPVGARAESADNLAIALQLKEAFDAGFQVGPKSAQEAQERLARVRRLAADDPRIDYSYGLVFVRQSQMKLAIVQFEAALGQKGPPLWPAWKAAIWSQLIDKRYEPGLKRLVEFAMLVHAAEDPGLPAGERTAGTAVDISEDQRAAARWIGQILEALAQLPDAGKNKELLEERESRVLDALGEELSLSVEEGRELLRARALDLGLAADAARDVAGQMAKRKKLDKELDALDKGKMPGTPEEWKKWIDDILAVVDKQLVSMDRDFHSLKLRADGLSVSYEQASTRLTTLRANMTLAHRSAIPMTMVMLKEQLVACSDQMAAYQLEYNVAVEQMSNVAERASAIADRRAKAIARYETETGDTIKNNPDLDKWATRIGSKRPKLAAKSAAKTARKDPADKTDAGKKRTSSLRSLMPLDLDRERDEILASFGLRPAPPVDAAGPGENSAAKAGEASAAPVGK